jgi:threonyl-tRNA synthetase
MHSIYTKQFGFTYEVKLATRPELSIGEDSVWEDAEA